MKQIARTLILGGAMAFVSVPLSSQTPPAKKPAFVVVSIRPSPANSGFRPFGARGDTFTMPGATLRMLLEAAFRDPKGGLIQSHLEIAGGPNWIDRDRYDITAKAECDGGKIRQDQIPLMLQSTLEDRFQLKAHFEARELPVYALVIAKNGLKLRASEDQSSPPSPGAPPEPCNAITEPASGQRGLPLPSLPNFSGPVPRGVIRSAMNPQREMTISGASVPIATLINVLEGQAGRHIIDRTGLKGLFDFEFQFSANGFFPTGPGFGPAPPAPSPTAPDPGVSLFTAMEERLGLKLESARGPVEVLVIDQVEKPSEN